MTRKPLSLLAAAALASATLLCACSSSRPDPTPLQPLENTIAGSQAWAARMGKVSFPLTPNLAAGRVHVADDAGTVQALDVATGAVAWTAQAGAALSAGVGSDGRYAAVVTRNNELVVFDGGAALWRTTLDTAVATAPLVAGERVFVIGVDRTVRAYDALDGRYLWQFKRPGDSLLLAQPTVLQAVGDTLLTSNGARWLALDPLNGSVRWETVHTTPRGTNEVERLADLVGPATRDGNVLCARAFQAAIGCLDAGSQTMLWSQNSTGAQPVAASASAVFSADSADRISARNRSSGALLWSNERLAYRGLSAPAALGSVVVFGDFEGWLHFVSAQTGDTQLRLRTDSSGVAAPLVVSGNTLIAVTHDGGVYAFKPQ